ncbi:4-hydroxy-tetrahydrodipicolinate reductase [Telmatospirillum siberiense]|uniref:4-hydroxy-tetrahydrodipicolinate reductase n=1 Tax=Telmatospirillum siberiense TaxID=382514 RepID=A0A2N3PSY8_9PROT|nr:4-hydroxy-tetrahydrodipicolinate reductase [Telmatospirillum siberiense]PKU23520.1 4-hydroxy-tetrahydrodipicolinate reductase [Telmatospirillum siberiense]
MTKIGIVGCAGRMGQMLVAEVLNGEGLALSGGTERPGGDAVGRDLGELLGRGRLGLPVGSDAKALFAASDVVIDFTSASAAAIHAQLAAETRTAYVVGTTGLAADQEASLRQAATRTAVVWAPNMSVGVNLLFSLVEQVAALLDPATYDIEILEMHHRHKVDAPSGTALGLGQAAARGRDVALDSVWQKTRDGLTGPRKAGDIGFATLRGGDVVGDHTVVFAADGERIELSHKASSRQIFAKGAIRAARWVIGRPPGLYSMKDVLGLA